MEVSRHRRRHHAICVEAVVFRHWTKIPKSTKALLQKKKSWKIVEWPSQSPGLTSVENLWFDLKKTVSELEAFARQERANMSLDAARSQVQQKVMKTLVVKRLYNCESTVFIKSCILCWIWKNHSKH